MCGLFSAALAAAILSFVAASAGEDNGGRGCGCNRHNGCDRQDGGCGCGGYDNDCGCGRR